MWFTRMEKQYMGASLTFIKAFDKDGDSLIDHVVTEDEPWVKQVYCETKKQSVRHTSSS